MMVKMLRVLVAVCAVGLAGCESMGTAAQSQTVQGGVLGSALGAGAGAIIGNQSGNAGAGAAIGAGLGALGGALMGNALQEQERRLQQQQFPPASSTTGATPAAGGRVKFSPVTGKEYPESMKYDPETGVELRYRE